jgi:hypothetical protein
MTFILAEKWRILLQIFQKHFIITLVCEKRHLFALKVRKVAQVIGLFSSALQVMY